MEHHAALEVLAAQGHAGAEQADRPGLQFSFSGLKTFALNTWQRCVAEGDDTEQTRCDISLAFQQAVVETLTIKCKRALKHAGMKRLVIAGWFVYDFLCDSALGKRPALLGFILFVLLVAAAFGLSKVFSGRGAYLHVGAIIGTIMVGNVFRIIMPAQRALVAAIKEGRSPDPALPAKGLLRSRHNNYFTLPVLFIMISNHFPSTYGSQYNWLILAGIAVLAVLVRHYFNTRHDSHKYAWTLPVAALGMICLAYVTGPKPVSTAPDTAKVIKYQPLPETALGGVKAADAPAPVTAPAAPAAAVATVDFEQVHKVIQERCTVCHSATPSSPLFSAAPAGVMFDTAQQIQLMAPRIQAQAVVTPIMPLGNITQMTQQERDLVGAWINAGARTN